jgi:hypothetical protein
MRSREQQQVRVVIGRRLREHYEAAASQTIPDRLAQLIEKIEQSESRSEQLRGGEYSSEQASGVSGQRERVRTPGEEFP